ncbi:hypothetical protein Lfu02_41180 [Longispora fulva]|uniref:Beta-lactam-binding protein with PASTA domain n=1 Tax=Longispora fulva TaxID=619741 RepID=A0A8J7KWH2_9ACTN|nr:PASTA domain-containing protein [Longispora fulva]MBG6136577.1 beta-lactam-binding protein with PASTA domain [Longispora fulva]GIG59746.1 hypothetical protein Lfu02_41180 [Longispora fulva]
MRIDEELFAVPHVSGLSVLEAHEALQAEHLNAMDEGTASDSFVGTVVASSPPEGDQLVANSFVTLFVSTGHGPTGMVPIVAGLDLAGATAALDFEGYVAIPKDQESFTVPSGEVIGTVPRAGTSLFPGALVTVIVAVTPLPPDPPRKPPVFIGPDG